MKSVLQVYPRDSHLNVLYECPGIGESYWSAEMLSPCCVRFHLRMLSVLREVHVSTPVTSVHPVVDVVEQLWALPNTQAVHLTSLLSLVGACILQGMIGPLCRDTPVLSSSCSKFLSCMSCWIQSRDIYESGWCQSIIPFWATDILLFEEARRDR